MPPIVIRTGLASGAAVVTSYLPAAEASSRRIQCRTKGWFHRAWPVRRWLRQSVRPCPLATGRVHGGRVFRPKQKERRRHAPGGGGKAAARPTRGRYLHLDRSGWQVIWSQDVELSRADVVD